MKQIQVVCLPYKAYLLHGNENFKMIMTQPQIVPKWSVCCTTNYLWATQISMQECLWHRSKARCLCLWKSDELNYIKMKILKWPQNHSSWNFLFRTQVGDDARYSPHPWATARRASSLLGSFWMLIVRRSFSTGARVNSTKSRTTFSSLKMSVWEVG